MPKPPAKAPVKGKQQVPPPRPPAPVVLPHSNAPITIQKALQQPANSPDASQEQQHVPDAAQLDTSANALPQANDADVTPQQSPSDQTTIPPPNPDISPQDVSNPPLHHSANPSKQFANVSPPPPKTSMPNLSRRQAVVPEEDEVKSRSLPAPKASGVPDKSRTVINVEPVDSNEHLADGPYRTEGISNQPTSIANPNYGMHQNTQGYQNSPVQTAPEKRISRDDYVFLTPPHEGELPVKAWPIRDDTGFHTPPHGTGAVILKDRTSPIPPPPRKGSFLYSSEDEHMGLSKPGSNETDPLLKPHSVAQDILNRMLGVDRDANRFDDFNWWCFRRQMYAMPSCFTNQTFRQTFAGQMITFKALQMFLLFLCAIIFQMIWTWDTSTPAYVTFIIQNFWLTPVIFAIYLGVLFFVRVFHIGRLPPRNWISYAVMTLLMGFLSYAGSVGLGDLIASTTPVVSLSITISYVIFYLLIIPKEWRYRVDVLERKMYYLIPPVVLTASLASTTIVFGLLQISGSVYIAEFEFVDTFLVNCSISLGITSLVILVEIYRIKQIIDGTYISIMADDEALFASFFV